MLQPKISVIVPVYNVEKYVSKCIESIINQTYRNLEIIIVNDGSTDKSGDICDYYAKKDDRIVLIHQENQGLSMARNNAIDIASGDYVGFVDSDDWIASDMYHTLYGNATEYGADISMCNFYNVREDGVKSPYSVESEGIKVLEGVYKVAHNIRLSFNCVWNRLYRRYLFEDIRFPKGKTFEDIFVMHRLVDMANRVVLSSECKYYYLLRQAGITLSPFNLKQTDDIEAFIERHDYVSSRYPNLEKVSRRLIFYSLLWNMRNAHRDNKIETHKEALYKIINTVRRYDFRDCGLSAEQKMLLELLFDDINAYSKKMHTENKQRLQSKIN